LVKCLRDLRLLKFMLFARGGFDPPLMAHAL
jgi:hypothetical protein